MEPGKFVYGLEGGEGPVPGHEGFEAVEGAVKPLQKVVANRGGSTIVAELCSCKLGNDVYHNTAVWILINGMYI